MLGPMRGRPRTMLLLLVAAAVVSVVVMVVFLTGFDAVIAHVADTLAHVAAAAGATASTAVPSGPAGPSNAAEISTSTLLSPAQETLLLLFVLALILFFAVEAHALVRYLMATGAPSPAALEAQSVDGGVTQPQAATAEGEKPPPVASSSSSSHGEGSATTFRSTLKAFVIVITVVILMLVVDGPFPWHTLVTTSKLPYDRDLFVFMCLATVTMAGLTLRNTAKHDTKPMQREQTDEWRGFMQIGFVLYHYFNAKEAYNLIRVFIAAYVFLTGFGNFSFFWVKKDFSFLRVCKMLLRLNLLVFFVCLGLNKPWVLYYVCPLHTFNFFVVYAAMSIFPHKNTDPKWMAGKFICVFVFLFILFEIPGVFDIFFAPLSPLLQYNGSLYEWRFRSTLDHYAVLGGMLVAYNFPAAERWLYAVEARARSEARSTKAVVAVVAGTTLCAWFFFCFNMPKLTYNAIHPYVACAPVIAYIVLRNLSLRARGKVLGMFQWSGRITLETYLLQFHIWLANDAKGLTQFLPVPEYYLLNYFLVTAIYVLLSNWVFEATIVLNDSFIPHDATLTRVAWNASMCLTGWTALYVVVQILRIAI